jgi:calcium-dependent protein kinase
MLAKNPEERITAEEALNSEWLTTVGETASKGKMQEVEEEVVRNLQGFHFQNKLKAVVYTYIASQLYSTRDKEALLKVFREMDSDGDGVIEKSELISVFNAHSHSTLSEPEIEKILQLIDTNGSGRIDFTEFLVAASNEEKMLERQRLENAFNYLDADHSGFITIEEVKAFLDGSSETSDEIKKIFEEVD